MIMQIAGRSITTLQSQK